MAFPYLKFANHLSFYAAPWRHCGYILTNLLLVSINEGTNAVRAYIMPWLIVWAWTMGRY